MAFLFGVSYVLEMFKRVVGGVVVRGNISIKKQQNINLKIIPFVRVLNGDLQKTLHT